MSEKEGWPLTPAFLEGFTRFSRTLTEGIFRLHELAQRTMEAAVTAQEVAVVTNAKVQYANELGARPTFWDLYLWCKDTGRPQTAAFLYANRHNPTITGLFGTRPIGPPPLEGTPDD